MAAKMCRNSWRKKWEFTIIGYYLVKTNMACCSCVGNFRHFCMQSQENDKNINDCLKCKLCFYALYYLLLPFILSKLLLKWKSTNKSWSLRRGDRWEDSERSPEDVSGSSAITVFSPMLEMSLSCSLSDVMFEHSTSTIVSTWGSFTLLTRGARLKNKHTKLKNVVILYQTTIDLNNYVIEIWPVVSNHALNCKHK